MTTTSTIAKSQAAIAQRANGTPWAILYQPRAIPNSAKPPGKTGPRSNGSKAQQSAISFETPEERKARQRAVKAARTAEILTINQYSDVGRNNPADRDRTNTITGKRITARHQ
jgi:hypothetical protein